MLNIGVLVSGGGTNLQALIDAEKRGEIENGKITLVVASRSDAYALERAKNNNIKSEVLLRKNYASTDDYSDALLEVLEENNIDVVVLAGFMTIISSRVPQVYRNRIINIHPALIPSFCGKGYYGLHVHEAALERGVKVSGATVHFVNEVCDGGPIIIQQPVAVMDDDTPETLQKRIMVEAEWKILPKAVSLFCQGKLEVVGNRVIVKE
ncbi:MAG: phosphoribosylglycinamide formyltransferase [Clostridia bacterium]|nr:phosphoribosylglycinamide formyltransferase [Clostridia bacterium]